MRYSPVAKRREEAVKGLRQLGNRRTIDLGAATEAGARDDPSAPPAEGDPPVGRGAEVVEHRARVGDTLATSPAELLEHVRHGLGDQHVAGGDRDPPAKRPSA